MCVKAVYNSNVRSVLEYSCVVWNPTTASSIARLEAIQRKLTRYALRLLSWQDRNNLPPYAARCHLLGLEPLMVRRRNVQCIVISGLLNGSIESSPLMHRIGIYAPSRPLRFGETLWAVHPRSSAGRSYSMFRMSAVFNTVSNYCDFNPLLQRMSPASAVAALNCDKKILDGGKNVRIGSVRFWIPTTVVLSFYKTERERQLPSLYCTPSWRGLSPAISLNASAFDFGSPYNSPNKFVVRPSPP